MIQLYVCHEIRGAQGEEASEAHQRANIALAVEKAEVLKEYFPTIEWIVPHANDIVNELYFQGKVSGGDIVSVECDLIRNEYDGIVVIGDYHSGTGVAMEIQAAFDSGKFIWYMDDVMEEDVRDLIVALDTEGMDWR